MKSILVAICLLFSVSILLGCGGGREIRPVDNDFDVIRVGNSAQYIIDKRVEACFLMFMGSNTPAAVDCATRKKNVKEAKTIITW